MTSKPQQNTNKDVQFLELPNHRHDNGELIVMQGGQQVPFAIARVFAVHAPLGATRGEHAHKQCSQLLVCMNGAVEVVCDDGVGHATYLLDRRNAALLIPPGIWASQKYRRVDSVLVVLCDRNYEEHDYIRDYARFREFRAQESA
jgi:dTDP-4-dehydrorhamnose 3,5-epimerase-like enzyme